MFERILVAVDGSPDADRAVRAGAEIARTKGGRLVVAHVTCLPEHYRAHLVDELEEAIRADGEKILEHAARVALEAGVEVEARLLERDHAAEALLDLGKEIGADLIVVGVRGRTPDQVRAMGSVSEAITRGAGMSVLLVRRT
jgi:nucleotide-binding universal stress UspA family protein